jgi:hypothetical protein
MVGLHWFSWFGSVKPIANQIGIYLNFIQTKCFIQTNHCYIQTNSCVCKPARCTDPAVQSKCSEMLTRMQTISSHIQTNYELCETSFKANCCVSNLLCNKLLFAVYQVEFSVCSSKNPILGGGGGTFLHHHFHDYEGLVCRHQHRHLQALMVGRTCRSPDMVLAAVTRTSPGEAHFVFLATSSGDFFASPKPNPKPQTP